jgi:predicted Zn finger-like uncharacterized protein
MDFRCPNCQKEIQILDENAGQLVKCPLCLHTFQAPALPPPVAPAPAPVPAPPADPGTYPVATEPAPPAAPPPPQQEAPRRKKEAPAAPPPEPTGDYTHTRSLWISPRAVPWLAPAALLLAFLLTFFPWATYHGVTSPEGSHIAWGWGFSQGNALTILYLFVLLFAFLLSAALTVLRLVPDFKVPAALQQVWPWRAGAVALLAFLGLFFLLMQLFIGFEPAKDVALDINLLHTTAVVWLTLLLQVVALVGALLDFWLEVRGPSRPLPRIDFSW